MFKLIKAATGFQRVNVTHVQAFLYTLPIILVEVCILLVFTFVDPPLPADKLGVGEGVGEQQITCERETDAFLTEEATRNAEEEFRRQQQQDLAKAMPQAERGTLPPLYFATGPENKRGLHQRRPSFSKLPKSDMFRTMSKSRDAEKAENKGFPPSKPMHRAAAPSVLSPEAPSQNYRGFFNLGIIILIVSNFRLILAAVKKHGFVL